MKVPQRVVNEMKLEELTEKLRKFTEKIKDDEDYYLMQGMIYKGNWLFKLAIEVKKRESLEKRAIKSGIKAFLRWGVPEAVVSAVTWQVKGYYMEEIFKPFYGIKKGSYVKKLLNHIANVLDKTGEIKFSDGSKYRLLREQKIKISAKISKDHLKIEVFPFKVIYHPFIVKLVGTDKIVCPFCGKETYVYSGYCEHCNKQILTLCLNCRRITPIGKKCIHCGKPLKGIK